ncbi:MAG: hypothetical protein ACK46X_20945 [Candidatus Sericytochromatia bacterium]
MMHRLWIPLTLAAAVAGCQAPTPTAGQFALSAANGAPAQRLLADTRVSFDTSVTTLAGTGTPGFMEGPAATARFNTPMGLTVDPTGTVYVADMFNMGIRMITPTGMVMTVGFPAALGQLVLPTSVVATPMGLAVLETAKNRVQFLSPTGTVTPFVGGGIASIGQGFLPGTYGYGDGRGEVARFQSMGDLCLDSSGMIFISDRNRVRMAYPNGSVVTIAGIDVVGHLNGPGKYARFNTVKGIVSDNNGHVYVVDSGNHRIRRITIDLNDPTNTTVDTIAGSERGYADNSRAINAMFSDPTDIAIDSIGNLYVTDTGNHRVRKILTDGSVITLAGIGEGNADGPGIAARFNRPNHIALDAAGNVYVTDLKNHSVRKIEQL